MSWRRQEIVAQVNSTAGKRSPATNHLFRIYPSYVVRMAIDTRNPEKPANSRGRNTAKAENASPENSFRRFRVASEVRAKNVARRDAFLRNTSGNRESHDATRKSTTDRKK